MQELFFNFLDQPNCENYLKVRSALLNDPCFDPYSPDLSLVEAKLREDDLNSARQMLCEGMPNLMLSPRAHRMLSYIAEQTGEVNLSEIEQRMAEACMLGMLATGQGSSESPYQVCRVSDQHDVVRYLGLQANRCTLHEIEGRHQEEFHCLGGKSIWFDVTDMFHPLGIRC